MQPGEPEMPVPSPGSAPAGSTPADDVDSQAQLSGKIAKGAATIAGTRFLVRFIGIANIIVLARLLTPADFGVVAIGVTIMQLLQNLSDIGVSHAVVRYHDAGRNEIDTLFTLSAIRGMVVSLFLLLVAPAAGVFYDDPRVSGVFVALGAVAFIQSLINPRYFEFERNLDFSREFIVGITAKVVAVTSSIAVAVIFRSYWALVVGMAAGITVHMLLSYAFRPYLPRLTLIAFRKLIGFTGWITGVSCLVALNNKSDPLILGRVIGMTPTGLYTEGSQMAELPSIEIATPIARAIYPGLSSLQDDPEQMRRTFLQGAEALALVAMPAAFGCAFIAQDFVALFLGDQWDGAVAVVRTLAPVFGIMTIYWATQSLAMALGNLKPLFFRELTYFLIRTPIFIAATVYFGLTGAIWAAAGTGLLYSALQGRLYHQVTGAPSWEPLWRARRSLLALVGMAAYFFLAASHAPWADGMLAIRLAGDIAAGAVAYLGCLWAIWRLEGQPDGVESVALNTILAKLGRA